MSQFIDRRANGKHKSAVNRQRFIRRFKNQIKDAVSDAIAGRSITDIDSGENISIPAKDISEPIFHHGQGGKNTIVHPGNEEFVPGDKFQRQSQNEGQGQGNQASDQGEGMDDFGFQISRDEFLELFFEDLELPNLAKKQISQVETESWVRAGYTVDGIPANINIMRSLRGAIGRKKAMGSSFNKKIKELEKQLSQLENNNKSDSSLNSEIYSIEYKRINEEIERLKKKEI